MLKVLFPLFALLSLLQGAETPFDPALRTIDSAGFLGSSLTLDDGSTWTVKPSDRALFRDWRDQQLREVFLTPNEGWILETNYPFCLVNVSTEESIEVRLERPPEGDKCSLITFVDSSKSLLEVVDSSNCVTVWHVSYWDQRRLAEWQPGDMVMIGGNVRWNSRDNPYILFHLKTEEYVRGKIYLRDAK